MYEEEERLSRSKLWKLQDQAYIDSGVDSWTQLGVPFQITSSPFIARHCARIALESLRTMRTRSATYYFLEIGAGQGKFAYHFLTELLPRMKALDLSTPICYLLTDLAEKNIIFCKDHPLLKPFIEQGVLEVAVYNPLSPTSRIDINPESPLFVIANYFFDSISQDLFRIQDGELFEGRITLHSSGEDHLFAHLHEAYSYHPISLPYYTEFPQLDTILSWYCTHLKNGTFLIPRGGFEAVRNLQTLTNTPLILLTGDKGVCSMRQLAKESEPRLNLQGTLSFPVNFHALSRYFEQEGGESLLPEHPKRGFAVCLYASTLLPSALKVTYRDQVDTLGPQELFDLQNALLDETTFYSLSHLLLHIQLSNWDASLFFSLFDTIQSLYTPENQEELLDTIKEITSRFYPLHREEGLLFYKLGLFLQKIGCAESAADCFKQAISFSSLPKLEALTEEGDQHSLDAFIHASPLTGDVLQLGVGRRSVSEAIRTHTPTPHTLIPLDEEWQETLSKQKLFDTILFIPPYHHFEEGDVTDELSLVTDGRKMIQEIENQFTCLKKIVYTDTDIDHFFNFLERDTLVDPKHFLHFFAELEGKGNITPGQREAILLRLETEGLVSKELLETYDTQEAAPTARENWATRENALFFSALKECLAHHMKKGAVFRGYLYNVHSKLEDNTFFDEIVNNPFLEYKEERMPLFGTSEVLWVTVKKY